MMPHPLAVNLILSNTFKYLSVEDLKSCRLVCQQWNYETIPKLKKSTATISFGCKENMKRFSKICHRSNNIPMTRINMSSHAFTEENAKLVDDFLLSINPFVEFLSISMDPECDYTYNPPDSLDLPKLKELVLIGNNLDSKIPENSELLETELLEHIPYIFQDLIRKSSNLTHLGLWFDPSCKEFGKLLIQLISLHPPRRLTNLDLRLPIGDAHLNTLTNMAFKLRKLSCDFPRSCFYKDSLKNFLSSQSKSLEYIVIDNYFGESCYTVEFPELPNVKGLKVDGRGSQARSDVKFSNFNYSKQFPSLRKLEIGGSVEWNACWRHVFPDSQRITTIHELKFSRDFVDSLWIRTISEIFPNLKKLKIWYSAKNPTLLPAVFQNMGKLTELTITFPTWIQDGNVDHALTGICKSKCEDLSKNLNLKEIFSSCYIVSQSININNSNISNLKNLRKLTLKGMDAANNDVDHSSANITDITVAFGLIKMQNLQELNMSQSNISDEGLQILQSSLLNCKLKLFNSH